MFDFVLTSRASVESDMQRIALGSRQRDIAVLETLVEQYQFRLVRYLVSLLGRRTLQIRYIGVSFGIGRYQPHRLGSPNQGDCKDKHTLSAATLAAAQGAVYH
jgi:hypothetical protein